MVVIFFTITEYKIKLNAIYYIGDAIMETNDDPEVIRAKYFIRDEFLVRLPSMHMLYIYICNKFFFFKSVYQLQVETANTIVTHISHAPWTQKTLNEFLMIVGT